MPVSQIDSLTCKYILFQCFAASFRHNAINWLGPGERKPHMSKGKIIRLRLARLQISGFERSLRRVEQFKTALIE
jgi:hypothetical protein